jgi:hypothetical protein
LTKEPVPDHPVEVNNRLRSEWLEFLSCCNRRRQEKIEAFLCFDVEFAVASGLARDQK